MSTLRHRRVHACGNAARDAEGSRGDGEGGVTGRTVDECNDAEPGAERQWNEGHEGLEGAAVAEDAPEVDQEEGDVEATGRGEGALRGREAGVSKIYGVFVACADGLEARRAWRGDEVCFNGLWGEVGWHDALETALEEVWPWPANLHAAAAW